MTEGQEREQPAQETAGEAATRQRMRREFARAERNRRIVRRLKVILPTLAVLIVLGGLAATWIARAIPDNLALSGAMIEDGRVVIEDPRLSGVDANDRPYELVAARAMQTIAGGAIDLEGIDASVSISDDTVAKIVAASGHYDPGGQTLALDGGLKVETTDGLTVEMRTARVDLKSGILTSDAPIAATSGNQSIKANAIEVRDDGQRIRLSGGVSMVLVPDETANVMPGSAERSLAKDSSAERSPSQESTAERSLSQNGDAERSLAEESGAEPTVEEAGDVERPAGGTDGARAPAATEAVDTQRPATRTDTGAAPSGHAGETRAAALTRPASPLTDAVLRD